MYIRMAGFGGLEIYSLMDREPVEIGKELRCGDWGLNEDSE